jgi:Zn-dependent protease
MPAMKLTLTFGQVLGIPLKVHLNWFLTAGLVTWALAVGYFPHILPGGDRAGYWLVGTATSGLFFLSVLLHELGHSLVALREGVPVRSITLFILGGVAHIGKEPSTAGAEFRIVAAGPLTSLTLAALFWAVGWSGALGTYASAAAIYLGQMNIILAVFNLLPGFPLDGGRILRAALWKWLKDFQRATSWATRTGIGVGILFVALGVGLIVWGDFFSGGWIAFVGWYLGTAARDGYRQTDFDDLTQEQSDPNLAEFPASMKSSRSAPVFDGNSLFLQLRPQTSSIIVRNPGRSCEKCQEDKNSCS